MTEHFILFMILSGYGTPSIATQEFNSEQACQKAAAEFEKLSCAGSPGQPSFDNCVKYLMKTKCVPKGE
jgi:hypothetical protein